HFEAARLTVVALDHEDAQGTAEGLLEADLDRLLDAHGPAPSLTGAAEDAVEDVGEVGAVAEVHRRSGAEAKATGPGARALGALDLVGVLPVLAVLVVLLALFRIRQDVVRRVDLLEPRFRRLVARVHVRVILPGKPAVGGADLLVARVALDAENLVVVLGH